MLSLLENRNFLLVIVGIGLFTLFIGNSTLSVWDKTESSYAQLSQNILKTGDFLTPEGNFNKATYRTPPLHHWTVALSYSVFGVNEFSTRFPVVLSYILTFMALFYLGKIAFDEPTALLSCMILGSSFLLPVFGKVSFAEGGLLLWQTIAMLSLFIQVRQPHWHWSLIFWTAVGLGVLQGGLPILILTFGTWCFLYAFKINRSNLLTLKPWFFLPLAIVPFLVWYVLTVQKGGLFLPVLMDLPLFQAEFSAKNQLPGYYLLLLAFAFLPWFAFLPNALIDTVQQSIQKQTNGLFFLSWLLFGWLIYEIIPSKTPVLVLGALPALGLLLAQQFLLYNHACERFHNFPINQHQEVRAKKANFNKESWVRAGQIIVALTAFFMALALTLGGSYYFGSTGVARGGFVGLILWGTAVASAIGLYARNAKSVFLSQFFGGLLFILFVWWLIVPVTEPARSLSKRTLSVATELVGTKTKVILGTSTEGALPSLPFYISQTFTNYEYEANLSTLQKIIENKTDVLLILDSANYLAIQENFGSAFKVSEQKEVKGFRLDKLVEESYWLIIP